MAITSTRQIVITNNAPLTASWTFPASSNTNAPGDMHVLTLSGTTTISFPTGGTTVAGVTILPPSGNTTSITLKGTSGDTGIAIHKVDPTSIAFDTTSTTQTGFVVVVSTTITGLRIVWT